MHIIYIPVVLHLCEVEHVGIAKSRGTWHRNNGTVERRNGPAWNHNLATVEELEVLFMVDFTVARGYGYARACVIFVIFPL